MKKLVDFPIGVFDSGVGGLTVVRELLNCLPGEDVIYLGDTGRYPYGPRSAGIVRRFALQNARFLAGFNVKILVVACNTASSVALDELQRWLAVPVIGVITPGAAEAVKATRNGKIGVLGTVGTINSGSYQRAITEISASAQVFAKACPLFVPLAEEGWLEGPIVKSIVEHYICEILEKGVDTLVLGCTHYPLLKNAIADVAGTNVAIIDSASSLAADLKTLLTTEHALSTRKKGELKLFVTDSPEKFIKVGEKFLQTKFCNLETIEIDL